MTERKRSLNLFHARQSVLLLPRPFVIKVSKSNTASAHQNFVAENFAPQQKARRVRTQAGGLTTMLKIVKFPQVSRGQHCQSGDSTVSRHTEGKAPRKPEIWIVVADQQIRPIFQEQCDVRYGDMQMMVESGAIWPGCYQAEDVISQIQQVPFSLERLQKLCSGHFRLYSSVSWYGWKSLHWIVAAPATSATFIDGLICICTCAVISQRLKLRQICLAN